MENLSLSSIWRDGVYQDSSHFICFNREGQEEINLRLPKRAFPNTSGGNFRIQERHCNSISETRIWHSILRFSFLFSSLPTSPPPPARPNDNDSNTLHWHHFQFSNSYYVYSIIAKGCVWAGGRGSHTCLLRTEEWTKQLCVLNHRSVKYFLLTKLQ